ncbi:unnamed protein product, partial [Parascedosporium putredinis]
MSFRGAPRGRGFSRGG